jgi:flagellar basal body-associated protein FliL
MSHFKTGRAAQQRAELAMAKERRRKRTTWIAIAAGTALLMLMSVANVVMEINGRQAANEQQRKDTTNNVQSGSNTTGFGQEHTASVGARNRSGEP